MTTGGELLVEGLHRAGVRHVWGLPGVQTLAVWDAVLRHPHVEGMFLRNEQALPFAAKAEHQAAGELAAVISVPGPGATNMLTGTLDAWLDSNAMLAITVDVPVEHAGKGCVHDADLASMFATTVKVQVRVDTADRLCGAVVAAAATAMSGRPGPVQIIVPGPLLRADHDVVAPEHVAPGNEALAVPGDDAIVAAVTALADAARPLVYLGGGVAMANATTAACELARRLRCPVVTSVTGRGSIPEDDPLSVGLPFFPGVAELMAAADAVLAIGTRFSEITTSTWTLPLPDVVVRVDIDPASITYNCTPSHALVGDAGVVLDELLARIPTRAESAWEAEIAEVKATQRNATLDQIDRERRAGGPVHPLVLTQLLRAALPRERVVTADGSATLHWLMDPSFPCLTNRGFIQPDVSQTLGAALPEAIGAAVALGEPVVCVSGDGGLMYNIGELSAVVQQGIDVKIVVFDDGGWYNSVRQFQDAFFEGRYIGTQLCNPDWQQLAASFGIPCALAEVEDDVAPALAAMLEHRGASMVVVRIDASAIAPRFVVRIAERRKTL